MKSNQHFLNDKTMSLSPPFFFVLGFILFFFLFFFIDDLFLFFLYLRQYQSMPRAKHKTENLQ